MLFVPAAAILMLAASCGGSATDDATTRPAGVRPTSGCACTFVTPGSPVPAPTSDTPLPYDTVTPGPAPTASRTPLPGESGIAGRVTLGPTCPVQRVDSPCPDRPYEATIQVVDADGRVVAETRSRADGSYFAAVAPGAYTVHPVSPNTLPRAGDVTVSVAAGNVTGLDIRYDSGIR